MNARTAFGRSVAATLVLVALGAGTAACSRNDPDTATPTSSPTSSSPTPSVDPAIADAERQARSIFDAYVAVWAQALQSADPDSPDLPRYVGEPLLGNLRSDIRKLKNLGAVQVGAQTATIVSTKVDLAAQLPNVEITACMDYSQLKLVYKSNNSPVPNSETTQPRVPAVVKVARFVNGQWLANEMTKGTHPC